MIKKLRNFLKKYLEVQNILYYFASLNDTKHYTNITKNMNDNEEGGLKRQPLQYYYHCIELADDFYLPQSIRDWAQQEAQRMKTEYKLA